MNWERINLSEDCSKYLRDTYDMFARIEDGRAVFNVAFKGSTPCPNDGGYYSIAAALKAKGLRS